MAVAFLSNERDEILFLQKKPKSTFLPGLLVPIGGHIEANEIDVPKNACLREIEEETGLMDKYINDLKLRYIVLRMKGIEEIRMQYVFFGNVSKDKELIESEEGSLSWIDISEIINKNVTATTKEIVTHYQEIDKSSERVYVGSMKSLNGGPEIGWSLLEDWESPIFN